MSQNKQTGPITIEGKQKASQNSRKMDIFTKGYLPSENTEEKQELVRSLVQQWDATDPTKQIIIRTIEQSMLSLERLMLAEKQIIEGRMMSSEISGKFVFRAGINPVLALKIPNWYFLEANHANKNYALYIDSVWKEANHLKNKYSDQIISQVQEQYPNLYDFVLANHTKNTSFITALGQTYKQSTVILNLALLMNHIKEKYEMFLLWAIDSERYQIIIDGLKSELMLESMNLDKSNRYATTFQNRILKGIQALSILSERERTVNSNDIQTNVLKSNQ